MTDRRLRLLVFNQYYWPGVEATAHLLSELCRELADEFDITVVTGSLRAGSNHRRVVHDGVTIVRVPSTAFPRTSHWRRAANYASYLAGSALAGLRAPRPDVVLCMTDPPVIADVAMLVARRFRAPLVVVSQDVFPEVAVELKQLANPVADRSAAPRGARCTSSAPTAWSRSGTRCACGSRRRARGPSG